MTRLLSASRADIAAAAAMLRAGKLVAFGTETVYGLGADATNGRAVASIFAAKGRPHFNPLICHFADAGAAFAHVHASDLAQTLAAAFWPGPLTMVLSRRVTSGVDLLAGAGLDTLAIRVPGSPPARDLLGEAGIPVAAPSANRSGSISPTTASDVLAELSGRIDAVLDFGPATVGLESTVLDLTGPVPFLLRPGGIPIEGIAALCGRIGTGISLLQAEASRGLRSPGLLVSHYAPVLPVRLNALEAAAGEALLAFGPHPPEAALVYQLSPDGDLQEAAARLFSGLRWLDVEGRGRGLSRIATMKVPEHGLGAAINDRLQRAASPR